MTGIYIIQKTNVQKGIMQIRERESKAIRHVKLIDFCAGWRSMSSFSTGDPRGIGGSDLSFCALHT